ncbi:MAG: hypothetical protein KGL02_05775 [Acidobacteriota bacterium]|nr:hypothetical protein [Acidobacteriota bacterium]
MNQRRSAAGAALAATLLIGFLASTGATRGASSEGPTSNLPDWSGEWQQIGATPNPDGGFDDSLNKVLKEMDWSPPNNRALQAKIDKIQAAERKEMEAVLHGANPGGAVAACTFGYPAIMLDSPLMFEVVPSPKETALIFSSREIRTVYTDGRQHPGKDDLWATAWGDSIGHWEGQTLVIDTIAVTAPSGFGAHEGTPILAFGGIEQSLLITFLSPQAHFIERLRMVDKNHLQDQMTVIDPVNLTKPWHLSRTYERVTTIHRMVYEDCEGEDRNPVVNGHFTLAPPPAEAPATAPRSSK